MGVGGTGSDGRMNRTMKLLPIRRGLVLISYCCCGRGRSGIAVSFASKVRMKNGVFFWNDE